eukprot:1143655-Pelagomonas_calceolata.AAC.10
MNEGAPVYAGPRSRHTALFFIPTSQNDQDGTPVTPDTVHAWCTCRPTLRTWLRGAKGPHKRSTMGHAHLLKFSKNGVGMEWRGGLQTTVGGAVQACQSVPPSELTPPYLPAFRAAPPLFVFLSICLRGPTLPHIHTRTAP